MTVIGNHELSRESKPGFLLKNQQAYQNVCTENPGDGPHGYERLAKSGVSIQCGFLGVGLDFSRRCDYLPSI